MSDDIFDDDQQDADESSAWIVTFADMVTLILTFFVLLFSMSSLEIQKFKSAMRSIQSSLGEYAPSIDRLKLSDDPKGQDKEAVNEKNMVDQSSLEAMQSLKMLTDIQDFIAKRGVNKHIVASVENDAIVLRVRDATLFPSGKAELMADSRLVLQDIASLIQKYQDFRVRIAGHTDDTPINTPQFPSNWELSAVRATTVLRFLIGQGVEAERMTATGYGDLIPVAANDTPENRALNRRVDFVLEKEKQ